MPVFMPDDD